MKRQLTVALGLAVIATPALASKARLEALGEDNFGSYYIHDNRNIFLNPAKINDNKDLVTYEFGASTTNAASQQDNVATPRAEGGVIKSYGNMTYGLHFGNSTQSVGVTRSLIAGNSQERNPIDLFVGGDAGVKWGANVTYENYDGSSTNAGTTDRVSSTGLRTRLGIQSGDLEAFAQVSLNGDVKNRGVGGGAEVEGKNSYFLGAGYMLNGYKLFADWKNIKADYGVGNTNSDFKYNEIRVGAGRQERLNDKAVLFTKASLENRNIDVDSVTAAFTAATGVDAAGKTNRYILPLTAGLEYDATSWLQFRTSVTQTVWGSQQNKPQAGSKNKTSISNTVVRAGASLKFGEFTVDGLISTTPAGGTPADTTATTNGGQGGLRTDQLMTRVSMTYRF